MRLGEENVKMTTNEAVVTKTGQSSGNYYVLQRGRREAKRFVKEMRTVRE